jgi:hypothetical protein
MKPAPPVTRTGRAPSAPVDPFVIIWTFLRIAGNRLISNAGGKFRLRRACLVRRSYRFNSFNSLRARSASALSGCRAMNSSSAPGVPRRRAISYSSSTAISGFRAGGVAVDRPPARACLGVRTSPPVVMRSGTGSTAAESTANTTILLTFSGCPRYVRSWHVWPLPVKERLL